MFRNILFFISNMNIFQVLGNFGMFKEVLVHDKESSAVHNEARIEFSFSALWVYFSEQSKKSNV